jgi:DNA-binding transcriptional LysR family regulator
MTRSLTDELRALPPGIHGEGDEFRGLAWPALEWLEREVEPGLATLETGAGSSTLAFARGGADHIAVTPSAGEEQRIRAQADRMGIDHSKVRFELGPSHEVLPKLDARPLDLVLIDGAHGFPYPVLDWWYVAPHLKVGGRMLIDDAYMPPVAALVDALRAQPDWEIEESVGYRTVVVRKTAEGIPHWDWAGERVGGRMSFRYLPPGERAVAAVRHRVFSTRAGLALLGLLRRRSGLRWRQTG